MTGSANGSTSSARQLQRQLLGTHRRASFLFLGLLALVAFWLSRRSGGPPRQDPAKVALTGEINLQMVWIPGANFWMGCSPGSPRCEENESPRNQVQVDGFWIGKYEVTQRQWQVIMGSKPAGSTRCGEDVDCPVEFISWDDAQEFIRRVGQGMRLPTEAEWELAARGGTTGARYAPLDHVAWHRGNALGKTQPVGRKRPNAYGAHDMLGNVWEWCQDTYESDTYNARRRLGARDNPLVQGLLDEPKVLRGGSWGTYWGSVSASLRQGYMPALREEGIGFRVARTATEAPSEQ
jgi:formylglycine-generating enzyme required for sulfatase activity